MKKVCIVAPRGSVATAQDILIQLGNPAGVEGVICKSVDDIEGSHLVLLMDGSDTTLKEKVLERLMSLEIPWVQISLPYPAHMKKIMWNALEEAYSDK